MDTILLNKLPAFGIKHKDLKWLEDYLFDRKQIVQYNGETAQPQPLHYGVLQRSILGPLLFLIYFNDIDDIILHSETIMFVDDAEFCTPQEATNKKSRKN